MGQEEYNRPLAPLGIDEEFQWEPASEAERAVALLIVVKLKERLAQWPHTKTEQKRAVYARGTGNVAMELLFKQGAAYTGLVPAVGIVNTAALIATDERRGLRLDEFRESIGTLAEYLAEAATDYANAPRLASPGPVPVWTPTGDADRKFGGWVSLQIVAALIAWPHDAADAAQCEYGAELIERIDREHTAAAAEHRGELTSIAIIVAYLKLCLSCFARKDEPEPSKLHSFLQAVGHHLHQAAGPQSR